MFESSNHTDQTRRITRRREAWPGSCVWHRRSSSSNRQLHRVRVEPSQPTVQKIAHGRAVTELRARHIEAFEAATNRLLVSHRKQGWRPQSLALETDDRVYLKPKKSLPSGTPIFRLKLIFRTRNWVAGAVHEPE